MKFQVDAGSRSFEIEVDHDQFVWVDGRPLYVDLEQVGGLPVYSLAAGDEGYVLFVEEGQGEYLIEVQGQVYRVKVEERRPRLPPPLEVPACEDQRRTAIVAPLAGRLLDLPVSAGDEVAVGQVVAVIESMKMQMAIKAPHSGVIRQIHGPPERDVDQGEELLLLGPA
jgi:biotin carboxyl carrier protein